MAAQIVNLAELKASTKTGLAKCLKCGHRWHAVGDSPRAVWVDCPKCKGRWGQFIK